MSFLYYAIITVRKPQMMPMAVPPSTCPRVWWTSIMREVITAPERIRVVMSHHVGLKLKMKLYAIMVPMMSPVPALWREMRW